MAHVADPPRYRYVKVRAHPLAPSGGVVPEHRLLLFARIGPGSHPCHYCGETVTWTAGGRTRRGVLTVDHVDGDPTNNADDNLVPSCHPCNVRKGRRVIAAGEPSASNGSSARVRGERRNCQTCGGEFVARPDKRPEHGRFCGRSCARKAQHARRL